MNRGVAQANVIVGGERFQLGSVIDACCGDDCARLTLSGVFGTSAESRRATGISPRAVYLGKDMSAHVGPEPFLRGIPRAVDYQTAEQIRIRKQLFPEFQIVNEESYYIGASNTIEDFNIVRECAPPGSKILIMRDMGLGDIVLSLPAVRELKRRLGDVHITYATLPCNRDIVTGHDFIDEFVPIHAADVESGKYDLIINWCRCLESYKIERNRGPRVESFSKMLGMGLPDAAQVVAPKITPAHEAAADRLLDGEKGPFIAVVMRAATWNRSVPILSMPDVFAALRRKFPHFKIIAMDHQPLAPFSSGADIDLTGKTKSPMEAAAVARRAYLAISPDTGMAHLCASFGVRVLALLSSMPYEWRYVHYGCVTPLHKFDAAPCVPCWDWQRQAGRLKYCSRDKKNHCMEAITPEEIADKAQEAIYG